MKFNIEDYKGKYVMHCKNEKEAEEFCEYMDSIGKPLYCSFSCYCGKNVVFFNNRTWASKEYAVKEGYTILEWSDFINKEFTKADLKTGDVIQRRDGRIEIVFLPHQTLICQTHGWNTLNDFREDLTSTYDKNWDIIAVRRPLLQGHCQFDAFELKLGTLIYERKEVEEMTLAEVCKLLGKEIKIVK